MPLAAAVHGALTRLPGWTVTNAEYHGEEGRWHVAVADWTNCARPATSESISASGATEVGAPEELRPRLVGRALTRRYGS